MTPEVAWVLRGTRHQTGQSSKVSSTPAHLGFPGGFRVPGCGPAGSRTLPPCYPKKLILHDFLPGLLLTQLGYSFNKGNDFSSPLPPHLCFPSYRVRLDTEPKNCWCLAQNPPLAFSLYYPPTLTPLYPTLPPCVHHIHNPASDNFPPYSQVPETRLDPQWRPADKRPGST